VATACDRTPLAGWISGVRRSELLAATPFDGLRVDSGLPGAAAAGGDEADSVEGRGDWITRPTSRRAVRKSEGDRRWVSFRCESVPLNVGDGHAERTGVEARGSFGLYMTWGGTWTERGTEDAIPLRDSGTLGTRGRMPYGA
jgi:hypothetical protein